MPIFSGSLLRTQACLHSVLHAYDVYSLADKALLSKAHLASRLDQRRC